MATHTITTTEAQDKALALMGLELHQATQREGRDDLCIDVTDDNEMHSYNINPDGKFWHETRGLHSEGWELQYDGGDK
jgi:hypothetical protein